MRDALALADPKPLKFAHTRLGSLLATLQVTAFEQHDELAKVADFTSMVATYSDGFMVVIEPRGTLTPGVPEPTLQLACLDASIGMKPVFEKFDSVVITSGTLSPIDLYPKLLSFHPVVRVSLQMSIFRPCVRPLVVTKGADQPPASTRVATTREASRASGAAWSPQSQSRLLRNVRPLYRRGPAARLDALRAAQRRRGRAQLRRAARRGHDGSWW